MTYHATLVSRAQAALSACGAKVPDGEGLDCPLAHRRFDPVLCPVLQRRRRGRGDRRRPRRLHVLARRPWATAGESREAVRAPARGAQGAARGPGDDRGGQDPLRSTGRNSGDDRHLRVRRRAVASARGSHHAVGATRPPAHGDLAPRGCRGCHLGLQLPRRGVVMEHRHRAGVRRQRRVEAVGDDSPSPQSPARRSSTVPSRTPVRRSTSIVSSSPTVPTRRPCSTTGASRSSARPARSAWARRSRRTWPRGSAGPSSSSAGTTPASSRHRLIRTLRCEESCSPRRLRQASGARRCDESSRTRRSQTDWSSASPLHMRACRSAIRSRRARSWGPHQRHGVRADAGGDRPRGRSRRHRRHRRRPCRCVRARLVLRATGGGADAGARQTS